MKLFSTTALRSVLVSVGLAAAVALAADFTTPRTFSAGSTIRASEMNDNFQAIQAELRRLQARQVAFVHTSTAASISSNWTCIDNAATNGKPDVVVTITHVYNPGGNLSLANYDPNVSGVWYYQDKWCIYHEDTSKAMTAGKTFNVVVTQP